VQKAQELFFTVLGNSMVKKTNVQVSEDSDIEHPTSNEKTLTLGILGTFPVYPG